MIKSFILAAFLAASLSFAQVSSIPSASGGGASTFDNIGSGTNTSATMTCGAGCTLVTTAGVFRLPNGTSAPGTCTVGDVFFDTDATAGSNFYGCTSTNTWTLLSGSGSGASYPSALRCDVERTDSNTLTVFAGASSSQPCIVGKTSFTAAATLDTSGTAATGTYRFEVRDGVIYARLPGDITGLTASGLTLEASSASFSAAAQELWLWDQAVAGTWDAGTGTDRRAWLTTQIVPVAGIGLSSSDSGGNRTLNLSTFTFKSKIALPLVACSGTTGTLMWDTLASNAPTATCSAGSTETTMMRGVADFPDSDGDYSVQVAFLTPDDWSTASDLDAIILWRTAATSGDVVWQIQTACRADSEVDDVAWNTASTVTDTAKGTTLQLNSAAITNIDKTGCAAGELLHVRLLRNRTHASDTIAAAVSLAHVELTARRSISQ